MSNFNTGYLSPLDPDFVKAWANVDARPAQQLEKPIIPVNELGRTVVEKDPRTGANILQNVQAAIREGASTIQLILTTPAHNAIGGRPKAYGKEVREAIREAAHANNLTIGGLEMPTSSHTNLSGLDMQRGRFSDSKQYEDMQEIRDAIQFVADVAEGGGVDIWSQEFQRPIFNAKWNKDKQFYHHPGEEKEATRLLVDTETGRLMESVKGGQKVQTIKWKQDSRGNYLDKDGNKVHIDKRIPDYKEDGSVEIVNKTIKDFEKEAEKWQKVKGKEETTPEEAFYLATVQREKIEANSQADRFENDMKRRLERKKRFEKKIEADKMLIENEQKILGELNKELIGMELFRRDLEKKDTLTQEEQVRLAQVSNEINIKRNEFLNKQNEINEAKTEIPTLHREIQSEEQEAKAYRELVASQRLKVKQIEEKEKEIVSIDKYAKKRSFGAYAELGLYSMYESENNPKVRKDKPLYVGPELGWPTAFGGHPEEFIELIKKSRKEMAKRLTTKGDDFYRVGMTQTQANQIAKKHIKGLFDTSHMGMWLRHFKRNANETEKQHQGRFNKWYNEMVDKLIDADVVGSIQVVNSYSGAHGHLPPGQGIFPVVDAVKRFKERGFKGFIVSEGHEEEQFEKGRITLDTWRAFGSPIGRSYTGPQPTWGSVNQGYFGRTYSPTFMVGAYSPSNDFKLWSEVPLE